MGFKPGMKRGQRVGVGIAVAMLWAAGWSAEGWAQAPRTAVWLERGDAAVSGEARMARERALRVELEARDIVLLGSSGPEAPASEPRLSADQAAVSLLQRSGTTAVLWLEGDSARALSWLFVRTSASSNLAKAPLPHPPDAIDAQLLAIAAASLLDQALSEPPISPPSPVVPAPKQVAAIAPLPDVEPTLPAAAPARVREPREPHDLFAQLGLVLTFAGVRTGMEASSSPPSYEVFNSYDIEINPPSGATEKRYLFDDTLAHIPDADSFDDYEDPFGGIPRGVTPASEQCEADGIVTRAGEMPSKFCVRVADEGFVPVPAVRLAFGAWLLPKLAVAFAYQWYFTIDPERFFGAQLLGVEARYLLAGRREQGFGLLAVASLSVGRQETPVPNPKPGAAPVNGLAGPLGASIGPAFRYGFTRELALIGSPALGGRFPESQVTIDFSVATELSF
jgi:hypothetical protein